MEPPLIFLPIVAASYDGIPSSKTDRASALMNAARNTGGSIGSRPFPTMPGSLACRPTQAPDAWLICQHVIPGDRPVLFDLGSLPRLVAAEFAGHNFGHLRRDLNAGAGIQQERLRSPRRTSSTVRAISRAHPKPPLRRSRAGWGEAGWPWLST